jgi:hypothetical protein
MPGNFRLRFIVKLEDLKNKAKTLQIILENWLHNTLMMKWKSDNICMAIIYTRLHLELSPRPEKML